MLTRFISFLFKLAGWKIVGSSPKNIPKAIWVVAPHTSNLDFFVGIGTRASLGIDIGYLAKSELFQWYSAWFFRATGGYPVYRNKSNNLVEAVVKLFSENDHLHIALAPEGTRKDVEKLKSGFYFMAAGAKIPLILVCFNHTQKSVIVSNPVSLTGHYETDMTKVYDFYLANSDVKKTWLKRYSEASQEQKN